MKKNRRFEACRLKARIFIVVWKRKNRRLKARFIPSDEALIIVVWKHEAVCMMKQR